MGGIILIIFMILGGIVAVCGVIFKFAMGRDAGRYPIVVGAVMLLLGGFILWLCSFKIIDAGEVGVEVKFGRIQENPLTEGWQSKSVFSKVTTYPLRLREYTMSSALGEGAVDEADSVQIRTGDNSQMFVDATVVWAVSPENAADIYKKVSANMNNLESVVIRPNIRAIMRDIGAKYTLDSIMRERAKYGDEVFVGLESAVSDKGLIIDKVLIRDISPPDMVDVAIQDKLKAEQDLAKKEFQKRMAEEDADIKRIEARGIADAQEIIQKKLTPLYVQYYAVENYKLLAESQNTTFIIAPTSTEGSGMPLILGAN